MIYLQNDINTLCTEEREDAAKLRQYNVRLLRAPLPGNKPIMKQAKKPFTKQAKKPFKLTKKQLTKQRLLRFALKQKQKRLTLGFRLQPRIEISHITENDILTKFVSITGGEAIFLTVLVILKKKLRKNPTRVLVAALQRLRPLVKTTTQIRAGKPIYSPIYLTPQNSYFYALKFLKESAMEQAIQRHATIAKKLALEIMDVTDKRGLAVKAKRDFLKFALLHRFRRKQKFARTLRKPRYYSNLEHRYTFRVRRKKMKQVLKFVFRKHRKTNSVNLRAKLRTSLLVSRQIKRFIRRYLKTAAEPSIKAILQKELLKRYVSIKGLPAAALSGYLKYSAKLRNLRERKAKERAEEARREYAARLRATARNVSNTSRKRQQSARNFRDRPSFRK